jgi:dolichol-phosphate mannosyltransferase
MISKVDAQQAWRTGNDAHPDRAAVQAGTTLLSGPAPHVSVVIPTRNEAHNVAVLVSCLEQALPNTALEIIFVDDSDDGTVAAIEAAREQATSDIIIHHREPGHRSNGLGGAVVEGLRIARAPWVCVMDGDLQHPPDLIPRLLDKAEHTGADLVVGSRYNGDGDAGGLNRSRTAISRGTTAAARLLFPIRLRHISDPMSGFFLLRRSAVDVDVLQPRGFKILLEIVARTPGLQVAEVGFQFGRRQAGTSKANLHEGLRYLSHLWHLRFGSGINALRFVRFLAVGASGLLVNMLLLGFATENLGLYYLLSAILATQGSTLWNFGLTEHWVFASGREKQGRTTRFMLFLIMNNAALVLRGPLLFLLTSGFGMHYLLSNLISLVTLTILRFAVADSWIWHKPALRKVQRPLFNYDIHGILSVASDVRLPELELFRTSEPIKCPSMRVRIGDVSCEPHTDRDQSAAPRRIHYDEGIGQLGFCIDVTIGETIDVLASPLLKHSPHVLYTNVVEPILRWTFVEKGYALVHGACVAFGSDAYLVTARTDTGKTTTILRLLDRQRRATDTGSFLSDDLTLVCPDGRVLTYPKPLTISRHTVAAINTPMLSRRERCSLLVQSRLHSRSGRKFAFLLSRTKLPVATINALVQWLIPPPKYHVQRLVPHVRAAREARLAGMIVIERGGDGDVRLDAEEGLDILMRNCEDAYGFPPYDAIKSFLHGSKEQDLPTVERKIVADALRNCRTTLMRSAKMDWSQRIPALVFNGMVSEERSVIEHNGHVEIEPALGTA